jgi:hypothetical protein
MTAIRHLLLTRLALGKPSEEWLRARIAIFEEYCAPSIRHQTCRNFHWLLAMSPGTPSWFVNRVRKAYPEGIFIVAKDRNLAFDWPILIPEELISPVLLTTRLDNDDMFHKDFVAEVQKEAKGQTKACALNAFSGYNMDQQNLRCYRHSVLANHFLSLLEFGTRRTVYCRHHNDFPEFYPTLNFCTGKPLWVEGVNGENLVNKVKPNGKAIAWRDIRHDFLPGQQEKSLIFVQIAAYRDAELRPTIRDILAKSARPDMLRFGICRQYSPADGFDKLDEYRKDERFRILDIPYPASKGVCWARGLTQQLYRGEEFTLQIDSHMRFARNWDEKMIRMHVFLQQQGYPKPLLTGYVPPYDPGGKRVLSENDPPLQMIPDPCAVGKLPSFTSMVIPYWEQLICPVPARYFAAGFCFTLGRFCREVPYDPGIYFLGEEISIALRAFTNGYDLFHPHRTLLWHYYMRKSERKHWDDDPHWQVKNELSYIRLKAVLDPKIPDRSMFGVGKIRTVADYERFAGMLLSKIQV